MSHLAQTLAIIFLLLFSTNNFLKRSYFLQHYEKLCSDFEVDDYIEKSVKKYDIFHIFSTQLEQLIIMSKKELQKSQEKTNY